MKLQNTFLENTYTYAVGIKRLGFLISFICVIASNAIYCMLMGTLPTLNLVTGLMLFLATISTMLLVGQHFFLKEKSIGGSDTEKKMLRRLDVLIDGVILMMLFVFYFYLPLGNVMTSAEVFQDRIILKNNGDLFLSGFNALLISLVAMIIENHVPQKHFKPLQNQS